MFNLFGAVRYVYFSCYYLELINACYILNTVWFSHRCVFVDSLSRPIDDSGGSPTVFGSSCSHIYHRDCILQWLNSGGSSTNNNNPNDIQKKHDDCPNCRQPMWDPDTYQLVKEDIKRQQNIRETSQIANVVEGSENV